MRYAAIAAALVLGGCGASPHAPSNDEQFKAEFSQKYKDAYGQWPQSKEMLDLTSLQALHSQPADARKLLNESIAELKRQRTILRQMSNDKQGESLDAEIDSAIAEFDAQLDNATPPQPEQETPTRVDQPRVEVKEQHAQTTVIPEPTADQKAMAAEKIADADAVAQQAAMKEHYKRMALSTAPFRKWNILGGSKASEAKITGYENGTVTLQKRSGKSVQVRASRLNKEDREYLDTWIEKARVDK